MRPAKIKKNILYLGLVFILFYFQRIALNGSKMILFGGDDGSVSTSSLYILDVPTMTWTQATSAFEGRSGMACAVSGNSFVVWGGRHLSILTTQKPPLARSIQSV